MNVRRCSAKAIVVQDLGHGHASMYRLVMAIRRVIIRRWSLRAKGSEKTVVTMAHKRSGAQRNHVQIKTVGYVVMMARRCSVRPSPSSLILLDPRDKSYILSSSECNSNIVLEGLLEQASI